MSRPALTHSAGIEVSSGPLVAYLREFFTEPEIVKHARRFCRSARD
jgi:hypothetical protein